MNRLRGSVKWIALVLPMAVVSCGGADSSSEPDLGSADIALTQVPADVLCVHIVAQGATRTRDRFFDVTPGNGTVLSMNRLPIGMVQFSGESFSVPCSATGMMSVPNFIADAVAVQIDPGVVASVTLVMLRNGRADVSVDFEGECEQTGGTCSAMSGFRCCAGLACDATSQTCRPPNFGDITAVFAQSCVGCHGGTNTRISLVADADLYNRLTTPLPPTVPTCAGMTLVVPGSPMASFILQKTAAMPPCGNRMPLRCDDPMSVRACLSDLTVALISAWIANGAPPM